MDFRQRLLHALQDWFGFRGVAVLHGDSLTDAIGNGCGVLNGYSADFLDEYGAGGWVSADPLRSERAFPVLLDLGVARLSELPGGQEFMDDFLCRHGITDKAAMVIDGGPAGVVYVAVSVEGLPRVPERDLAVLRRPPTSRPTRGRAAEQAPGTSGRPDGLAAHAPRVGGRRPGGAGPDQPADRRQAVHRRRHGQEAPQPGARGGVLHQPNGAGRPLRGQPAGHGPAVSGPGFRPALPTSCWTGMYLDIAIREHLRTGSDNPTEALTVYDDDPRTFLASAIPTSVITEPVTRSA
jgi:hypothetical protein